MTEIPMSNIDNEWLLEKPIGYQSYRTVYGISVAHLMLYFIKHIRRHKCVEYAFFDKTGSETSSYVFRMSKDGQVFINQTLYFDSYQDAWQYYQDLLYQEFIAQ